MAKAKAKVTTKIKKKFWFPILAPKVFNNAQIGEIYLAETGPAIGRTFWHGLNELTENMRDQSIYINFLIKNAVGNSFHTEMVGYKINPNAIKKMVRRHSDRSDDSFIVLTSDNKKVRLKTLILTAHNTKSSVSTRLKNAMIKKLTEDIKKINFGNLLDKLVSYKLQMETKKFLTKIYPVKGFQVKYMGLEKEKIHGKEETEEELPETIEETPETPEEIVEEKTRKEKKKKKEEVEEPEEQAAEEAVETPVEATEELVEEKK